MDTTQIKIHEYTLREGLKPLMNGNGRGHRTLKFYGNTEKGFDRVYYCKNTDLGKNIRSRKSFDTNLNLHAIEGTFKNDEFFLEESTSFVLLKVLLETEVVLRQYDQIKYEVEFFNSSAFGGNITLNITLPNGENLSVVESVGWQWFTSWDKAYKKVLDKTTQILNNL